MDLANINKKEQLSEVEVIKSFSNYMTGAINKIKYKNLFRNNKKIIIYSLCNFSVSHLYYITASTSSRYQ